jgi:hypothetical protein
MTWSGEKKHFILSTMSPSEGEGLFTKQRLFFQLELLTFGSDTEPIPLWRALRVAWFR